MSKIIKFLKKFWLMFVSMLFGSLLGLILYFLITSFSLAWILAFVCCVGTIVFSFLYERTRLISEYNVLKGKKEVVDTYNEIIQDVKQSMEYFNGYDETLTECFSVYSDMVNKGVEAPIANSIVALSQDVGTNNTILLINIDHNQVKWNLRIAGRAVYLTQLKEILNSVDRYLERSSKLNGTLVINNNSSIVN